MIVAGADSQPLQLNKEALRMMQRERQLVVLENTTSSFGDGRMDQVMGMTRAWLVSHMEIPGVQVSSRMF